MVTVSSCFLVPSRADLMSCVPTASTAPVLCLNTMTLLLDRRTYDRHEDGVLPLGCRPPTPHQASTSQHAIPTQAIAGPRCPKEPTRANAALCYGTPYHSTRCYPMLATAACCSAMLSMPLLLHHATMVLLTPSEPRSPSHATRCLPVPPRPRSDKCLP